MSKNGVVTATAPGCRWIDVEDPDERTLAKLARTYGFSKQNMEDIISPTQRPKLDVHEDYVFFVFRFPLTSKGKHARTSELDVILTKDSIITFHSSDLHVVRGVLSDTRLFKNKRASFLGSGPSHVLFELLLILFESVYTVTDELAKHNDAIESEIFSTREQSDKTINRIAQHRRRMLDYIKVAKPQANYLRTCLSNTGDFISPEVRHKWRSLIDTAESQWELFDTSLSVLTGLSDSSDSLTTHRFNQTVRLLTIISVIFLPATFFLNIVSNDTPGAPLQDFEPAFIVVLAVLLSVQLAFIWFLRRRRVL